VVVIYWFAVLCVWWYSIFFYFWRYIGTTYNEHYRLLSVYYYSVPDGLVTAGVKVPLVAVLSCCTRPMGVDSDHWLAIAGWWRWTDGAQSSMVINLNGGIIGIARWQCGTRPWSHFLVDVAKPHKKTISSLSSTSSSLCGDTRRFCFRGFAQCAAFHLSLFLSFHILTHPLHSI